MKLRITYYAEGRMNGCKCNLANVCGNVYDDFLIDFNAWTRAHTGPAQEEIILRMARRDHPEADWGKDDSKHHYLRSQGRISTLVYFL